MVQRYISFWSVRCAHVDPLRADQIPVRVCCATAAQRDDTAQSDTCRLDAGHLGGLFGHLLGGLAGRWMLRQRLSSLVH